MKLKFTQTKLVEIPEGATHYTGHPFDDDVMFYKETQRVDGPYTWYYHYQSAEWRRYRSSDMFSTEMPILPEDTTP